MSEEYTIEDLAKRSGLPVRTVRYYMQQGLVPGPDTAGKYASYSSRHLDHLRMIQRLKGLHLPLKEISHLITNMSVEDMRHVLHFQEVLAFSDENSTGKTNLKKNSDITSAMDYIEGLAQRQGRVKRIAEEPTMQYVLSEPNPAPSTQPERWSKIRLAEGVELNVREQESRALRKEIALLIESAKRILGKNAK